MSDAAPCRVSIVILTFRSAGYIEKCLTSLIRLNNLCDVEIVVVDNASADGSAQIARDCAVKLGIAAKVEALPANLGCAGGNNAGWRLASGDVIVFLNPDTEVTPNFIDELVAPMFADATVGVTGAKIYYPGTTRLQHAGGFIHPNGMTGHYGAGEPDDAGKYDDVPAYFEETDLCTRIRRAGFKVLYIPTALLYHHESVTLAVDSPGFRKLYQKMRIMYLLKNLKTWQQWRKAIGFEKWWMLHSPHSRGYRLEQFCAYVAASTQMAANWMQRVFSEK